MVSFLSQSITLNSMKTISSEHISSKTDNILKAYQTCINLFTDVKPALLAHEGSLVFLSKASELNIALAKKAQGFIFSEATWTELNETEKSKIPSSASIWTTRSIHEAMVYVLPLFDSRKDDSIIGAKHPTAVIHPTAKVAETASIGAYVVIEAHATVGEYTKIYPHVYIGHSCHIGSHCEISSHASIGCDGFGFFSDRQGQHHKIPQIGNVVIEDNCEIGSQCAVDRATLTETRIKKGTKIDNLCHISHNVEIGENGLITAGFIVAGSTKIGKNLTTAGGVHITGHVQVTDRVTLSGRAGVTNDITEPGVYGGFPLENHKDSIRTLISIPQIKILRKQVKQILKHLNLNVDE